MRHHASWNLSWIFWAALAAAILLLLAPRAAHGQPVIFSVETHGGNDTLYVGEQATILFEADGQGALIQGLVLPLEFSFGAGSLIGVMPGDASLDTLPRFIPQFISEPPPWNHLAGTDPDTLVFGGVSLEGPWVTNGSEWFIRLHFQPLAPGEIWIDSITLPPAIQLAALNPLGAELPLEWHSPVITVLPCPTVLGDVNQNGQVTAADIILFINCIFLCGPGPFDILEIGDVNCDGVATVSDVIHIVNYVFKGVPLPFCCKVLD